MLADVFVMARDGTTGAGYPPARVEAVLDALLPMLGDAPLRPWRVGLSGLPGSGKSTLARQLAAAAQRRGIATVILSLDDFYLGRGARRRLARETHPLLMTRGVPGTHDVALLMQTLADLAHAAPRRPVFVPRFDKGHDTRLPRARWRRIVEAPQLVLLEGWCVGVPAQDAPDLLVPLNALERDEDRDGRWRRWTDAQLAGAYATLWRQLDRLMLLEAPDYAVIVRWRDQQEQALRARHAPQAMDAATLHRFLMHYERIARHALRTLPERADLRILLDADRNVRMLAMRQAG